MTKYYLSKNIPAPVRDFPLGSMQGNYTLDELNERFDDDFGSNESKYYYDKKTLKELNRLWKKYAPHPDVNLWTELVGSPWDIRED